MVDHLVVDASVAVKWYLPEGEDDLDAARLVLDRFSTGQLGLVAPDLIVYEVASAVTVATIGRQPRLSPALGDLAIARFLALELRTANGTGLLSAAFALVHRHGCALYDASYLALAQRLGIRFITADRKLHRRIGELPEVVWLADYPSRSEP